MSEWDGVERRSEMPRGFTIRYELLGIIGIMMLQLVGAIWWASSVAADVKYLRQDVLKLTITLENDSNDRYRGADAKRDFAIVESRLDKHEDRILNLERVK